MRRGGIAKYAVWIALEGIGGTGVAACTDFGGDIPSLLSDGSPDVTATSVVSANSPGSPAASWDVMVPDAAGGGALSDADASGGGGDDGSAGSSGNEGSAMSSMSGGAMTSPGTDDGASDAGLEDTAYVTDDAEGSVVEGPDASDAAALDTGTVEVGVPDVVVVVPDAGVDVGAPDTGAADTGAADADASLQDGGADVAAVDSGSPDSSVDSGADSGAGHGCNPNDPLATTQTCIAAQNKPVNPGNPSSHCAECVQSNGCYDPSLMGGTCEQLMTTLAHFSGSLPDGKTCSAILGTEPVTEKTVCMQTLQGIFSSKCASSQQLTPCLCGTTDPTTCLAGTAPPTGPLYDEYVCDFNATSGATLNTDFIIQTFGAGMANSIAQCAGAFMCDCF